MRNPRTARVAVPLILAIGLGGLGACSGVAPGRTTPGASTDAGASSEPSGPAASADPLTELAEAGAAEGALTVIGLDPERCGYREALDTFAKRYAIEVTEREPDASSEDQLAAIDGATAGSDPPDVVELDPPTAAEAARTGALASYRVATWDSIPEDQRDADGRWAAGYLGAIAFETNLGGDIDPPSDWSSLLEGSQRFRVGLPGDPRSADDAIAAVYAASLANGGSVDNAKVGLDYFAGLADRGRLLGEVATSASIARGATPVAIRWTWDALAHQEATNGSPEIDVTIPASGRLGGFRAPAISANAPHPNAARLWLEYLFSDEGQTLWLGHHCVPARFTDLADQGAIPPDVQANAPDISDVALPSPEQWSSARAVITGRWDEIVGVDIR